MLADMNLGHLKRILEATREELKALDASYNATREKLAIAEFALLAEIKAKLALEKERGKR